MKVIPNYSAIMDDGLPCVSRLIVIKARLPTYVIKSLSSAIVFKRHRLGFAAASDLDLSYVAMNL